MTKASKAENGSRMAVETHISTELKCLLNGLLWKGALPLAVTLRA